MDMVWTQEGGSPAKRRRCSVMEKKEESLQAVLIKNWGSRQLRSYQPAACMVTKASRSKRRKQRSPAADYMLWLLQVVVPQIMALVKKCRLRELEQAVGQLPATVRKTLFLADPLRQVVHMAFTMRHMPLLKFLLQKKWVSLLQKDFSGRTVLYRAVLDNEIHYVRLLLSHGADVRRCDCQEQEDCPPIMQAAIRHGSVEMVSVLMEAGIDVHSGPDLGPNALFIAASLQKTPCVDYFLSLRGTTQSCRYRQDCIDAFNCALRRDCVAAFTLLWPHQPDTCPSRMALLVEALFQHSQEGIANEITQTSPEEEQILQLELIGAFRVTKGLVGKAMAAWTSARELQQRVRKTSALKARDPGSLACLLDTREAQTGAELQSLERSLSVMLVQSLLRVERILPASRVYFRFLGLVAEDAWENKEYSKFVALVKRAADDGQDLPEHRKLVDNMILITSEHAREDEFNSFTHEALLAHMQALTSLISHREVCDGSNKAGNPSGDHHEETCDTCLFYNNVDIYFIMTLNQFFDLDEPSGELMPQLRDTLASYVQLRQRLQTFSPFFTMVDHNCIRLRSVEALVQVSASISESGQNSDYPLHLLPDSQGETPLHYFAESMRREELEGESGLISLFVQHGAHLCTRDIYGTSIRDILERRGVIESTQEPLSLQCLAARVARQSRGEWVKDDATIPNPLRKFILKH